MASKHSKKNAGSSEKSKEQDWQRRFLPLTLTPLTIGVLFFGAALLGADVWGGSPVQMAIIGVLFILLSFTASNALQKQWVLAGGWLALGISLGLAVWVGLIPAAVMGAIGLLLLFYEFLQRYWEHQRQQ